MTDGVAASRKGPGQCGYGGRGQASAELLEGWSGMVNSE